MPTETTTDADAASGGPQDGALGRTRAPGSLIVSFAGSFLRQLGGWIPVADLVETLGVAGVVEPAVRQALVRLKTKGFLVADKRSGVAGYALTPSGLADLETGDRRIFRFGEADAAQGWVLAVFSVPEKDRDHRHQLRSQLAWLGFGTVAPGVWVAPNALAGPARELLTEQGLDSYVSWFAGQHLGPVDPAQWWDLPALQQMYQGFLDSWRSAPDPSGPAATFAAYLHLIDDWRLFPRLDPGLPAELLPADWHGRQAWELFSDRHQRWHATGLGYLQDLRR